MPDVAAAYSPTRRAGDLVFVSGQLGVTSGEAGGDVATQTRIALTRMEELLATHGGSRADVVKCTVFLVRMADWSAMNAEYGAFFGQNFPSRSAVGAELIGDALVEIEAVAYLPPAHEPK